MKYIYLFLGLCCVGCVLVCITRSEFLPIAGLSVLIALFFNWLHAAEVADFFSEERPPYPLAGIALATLLAIAGIVAEVAL